jgi:hypothetical protein
VAQTPTALTELTAKKRRREKTFPCPLIDCSFFKSVEPTE